MSIISALREERHQSNNLADLALLPQTLIMSMAQRGEIEKEMVMPILAKKAEMADATARNAALAQGGAPKPTVLEQIMAKNAQAENPMPQQQMQPQMQMPQQMAQAPQMEDVGIASQATQPMSMAGGGIIAFDNGGDVEDEDNSYDERLRLSRMQSFGTPVEDLYKMLKGGYDKAKSYLPESLGGGDSRPSAMTQSTKSNHPLQDKAIAAAKQVGLDPSLMLHALNKETGGLKDPSTAMSKAGAYGPMQLMAGTARDLGVDRRDVDQNIFGGAMYLKQMMDKYKDPQLALAAYNAGPGRVDKALRSQSGIAGLPRETQGYMHYADGGEVRHFEEGGYSDLGIPLVSDPEMGSYKGTIMGSPENLLESGRITTKEYENIKKRESATRTPPPKVDIPAVQNPFIQNQGTQNIADESRRNYQGSADNDLFAKMITSNMASREANAKSSEQDKYLSLLAAGLGIMGGTSPYAMTNIGQGAAKGVEYMGASKARRASELNAINKADIEAQYYGSETSRKNQTLKALESERAIDNLAAYDAKLRKNYFMEGVAPTPKQLETYENARKSDPIYQRLSRDAGVFGNTQTQPIYNYNPKTKSI